MGVRVRMKRGERGERARERGDGEGGEVRRRVGGVCTGP